MKKIGYLIIFVVFSIVLYFYHSITYNQSILAKKLNYNFDIKNDYVHFFNYRNKNPIYVFKKKLLDKYVYWAFENKKSGLIFSHQQMIADINYIYNLQYIASVKNTYEAEFLTNEFNYTTNLSPFWYDIYKLGELLLPISKQENVSYELKKENREKVAKLGEKGIYFNCNKQKIDNILSLSDKDYLNYAYSKTGAFYEKNKNPCKDYKLADNLGFNYFYYLKDYISSSRTYKIAGFHQKVPYGIIGMISIINSLAQEHEKSIYLFVEKLKGIEKKLNQKNIKKNEYETLTEYYKITMNRLQEEYNLYIISQAYKNQSICKKDYNCLVENGFIGKQIQKEIEICNKVKGLEKIKKITDIEGKDELQKAKCFLLYRGIQKNYIQKNKLISPLLNSPFYKYSEKDSNWISYKKSLDN